MGTEYKVTPPLRIAKKGVTPKDILREFHARLRQDEQLQRYMPPEGVPMTSGIPQTLAYDAEQYIAYRIGGISPRTQEVGNEEHAEEFFGNLSYEIGVDKATHALQILDAAINSLAHAGGRKGGAAGAASHSDRAVAAAASRRRGSIQQG